jgi:hypothetical protein
MGSRVEPTEHGDSSPTLKGLAAGATNMDLMSKDANKIGS